MPVKSPSVPEKPSDQKLRSARSDTLLGWAFPLEARDGTKYEAVIDAISAGIASGALRPGQRLPPQRVIAQHFNVTIATITKAIAEAAARGLVVARPGSGTFVSSPVVALEEISAELPANVVDLSLNTPPAALVATQLQEVLRQLTLEASENDLFGYEAIPGSARNRSAGAAWLAQRDLDVPPERLLLTQGAHEGLLLSLFALTEPGSVVLCERLNYTGLNRIGQMLRLKLVGVDVDSEGFDVEALPGLFERYDVKAIVCTPDTHNPTTATLSRKRRAGLVAAARQADVPIIEDDVYGALAESGLPPLAALWPEGVVLTTSASKSIAPGLRAGYILAPDSLLPRIRDSLFMVTWTEPSLHAALLTRLIETGRASECIAIHRQEAKRRMRVVRELLGAHVLSSMDIASYHLWIDTRDLNPDDVAAELNRHGVLVSPAQHFLVDGSEPPAAIRLSLGNVADISMLERPLHAIGEILSRGKSVSLSSIV